MDGVVADFLESFLKFHNGEYGTRLSKADFKRFWLSDVIGITFEEEMNRIHKFYKTHHFQDIRPVEGAVEGIDKLSKSHSLIVISARQDYVIEPTKDWLERHFPNKFSNVYFTNHVAEKEKRRRKSDVCDRLGIDVMVEDSIEYAAECATNGRKVILPDRPWNQTSQLPSGVTRAYSWSGIIEAVEEIYRQKHKAE